uniref:Uncharacterized protein n=1 Tax=viral metagenome TaxID=1070528 RepID=A0A6H2A405_9ZZZZ
MIQGKPNQYIVLTQPDHTPSWAFQRFDTFALAVEYCIRGDHGSTAMPILARELTLDIKEPCHANV